MRAVRLVSLATASWLLALSFSVVSTAQAPMSEADYDTLMKSVGATAGALRKNLTGGDAGAMAADAKKMVELQKGNVAFWKTRNAADASEWATAALNHASALDAAVAAKNMDAAAASVKMLMGTCGECHGKYRDKAADGTYILKKQ